jgi:DNA topoisomerase-2
MIENPAFDSQTKETLTSKPSTFGSKCDISEKFFTKLAKSSIIDNIVQSAEARE